MKITQEIAAIIAALKELYPDAACSLDYGKDYELLFSVRLAAQCTDARVNLVTPALFQRYPLAELIVHPRVQKDMYKNTPRRAYFARALADSPFPVCYNGDLYTVPALEAFQAEFPAAERIMLGRGLAGDPALARKAEEIGRAHV